MAVAQVHHGREPVRPRGGHRGADVRVDPLAEELIPRGGRLSARCPGAARRRGEPARGASAPPARLSRLALPAAPTIGGVKDKAFEATAPDGDLGRPQASVAAVTERRVDVDGREGAGRVSHIGVILGVSRQHVEVVGARRAQHELVPAALEEGIGAVRKP